MVYFSVEEFNAVLSKIDEEFLIHSKNTLVYGSDIITNETITNIYLESVKELNNNLFSYNYYKSTTIYSNRLLEESNYNTDLKINKYGYIGDHVYEEDQPIVTKLYLLVRNTGELVETTYSNTDGYFEFHNIDKTLEYVVISPHLQHQFNSIIKDYKLE